MNLAYLYLLRASQIPFPTNHSLFIEKHLYDYEINDMLGRVAWYVKEYKVGFEAMVKAIRNRPLDMEMRDNVHLYEAMGYLLPEDLRTKDDSIHEMCVDSADCAIAGVLDDQTFESEEGGRASQLDLYSRRL